MIMGSAPPQLPVDAGLCSAYSYLTMVMGAASIFCRCGALLRILRPYNGNWFRLMPCVFALCEDFVHELDDAVCYIVFDFRIVVDFVAEACVELGCYIVTRSCKPV